MKSYFSLNIDLQRTVDNQQFQSLTVKIMERHVGKYDSTIPLVP